MLPAGGVGRARVPLRQRDGQRALPHLQLAELRSDIPREFPGPALACGGEPGRGGLPGGGELTEPPLQFLRLGFAAGELLEFCRQPPVLARQRLRQHAVLARDVVDALESALDGGKALRVRFDAGEVVLQVRACLPGLDRGRFQHLPGIVELAAGVAFAVQ